MDDWSAVAQVSAPRIGRREIDRLLGGANLGHQAAKEKVTKNAEKAGKVGEALAEAAEKTASDSKGKENKGGRQEDTAIREMDKYGPRSGAACPSCPN